MATLHTRHKLIDALSQAAELEHLLCCSYLYAAFSLKRKPDATLTEADTETTRKWATSIMLVARQEMEHLGMVCNMLSAIGAGANLTRPNFPQSRAFLPVNLPFELRGFGEQALANFIEFEKPDWNEDATPLGGGWSLPYTNLQELYEYIRDGFDVLNGELGPEKLFIGPTGAQVTNENLFGVSRRAYSVLVLGIRDNDPAKRLGEAQQIINNIITEGEGAPGDSATSHYARFVAIQKDLAEIRAERGDAFQPALPVALNPCTFRHSADIPGALITHPLSLEVAKLFNLVYETMMMILIRFYAGTDEGDTETTAMQEIAFFPLMTMGIRPLAEVLMELPLDETNSGVRAGPTFEATRSFKFLPHQDAAWQVLQEYLDELGAEATRVAGVAAAMNSPAAERLLFISKSLVRNAKNFGAFIQGKEDF